MEDIRYVEKPSFRLPKESESAAGVTFGVFLGYFTALLLFIVLVNATLGELI
jgi:hypothetical protein